MNTFYQRVMHFFLSFAIPFIIFALFFSLSLLIVVTQIRGGWVTAAHAKLMLHTQGNGRLKPVLHKHNSVFSTIQIDSTAVNSVVACEGWRAWSVVLELASLTRCI